MKPEPHVFSGAGCFIINFAYSYEKSLIQFNLLFNLFWQMFDGNFIDLFSKQNKIFPLSCTDPDWLENARWLKPFLFSCKKKYLKKVSIKHVLFYQRSRIIFTFKQDLKMRSGNHRKLSKFGPTTPQAALLTKKSLKPEPHPAWFIFNKSGEV